MLDEIKPTPLAIQVNSHAYLISPRTDRRADHPEHVARTITVAGVVDVAISTAAQRLSLATNCGADVIAATCSERLIAMYGRLTRADMNLRHPRICRYGRPKRQTVLATPVLALSCLIARASMRQWLIADLGVLVNRYKERTRGPCPRSGPCYEGMVETLCGGGYVTID